MQRIKKLPWAETIVIAAVAAIGIGVYAWTHSAEPALEESKQRGAAIANALEAYRTENGTYPERLDELIPRFIERIEQPTWGSGGWQYRRYPDGNGETADATDQGTTDTSQRTGFFELFTAAPGGYPVLYYDAAVGSMVLLD